MEWWLIIGAVVIVALVFAYREHGQESRRLGKLFKLLAAKHRGQVKRGSFLLLPQLRFETDHGAYWLGTLANSGSHGDPQGGGNGPFTFLILQMPKDSGRQFSLRRKAGQADAAVTLEEAYRIKGTGAEELIRFLPPRLARKLLESRLSGLELRLEGAEITLHSEGYAQSKEALDEMIELAGLLAEACLERAAA